MLSELQYYFKTIPTTIDQLYFLNKDTLKNKTIFYSGAITDKIFYIIIESEVDYQVLYRGSHYIDDFLIDFYGFKTTIIDESIEYQNILIQDGVQYGYCQLNEITVYNLKPIDMVIQELSNLSNLKNKKIVIGGHSLGGAFACLFAFNLLKKVRKMNYKCDISLYCFSGMCFANAYFFDILTRLFIENSIRFSNTKELKFYSFYLKEDVVKYLSFDTTFNMDTKTQYEKSNLIHVSAYIEKQNEVKLSSLNINECIDLTVSCNEDFILTNISSYTSLLTNLTTKEYLDKILLFHILCVYINPDEFSEIMTTNYLQAKLPLQSKYHLFYSELGSYYERLRIVANAYEPLTKELPLHVKSDPQFKIWNLCCD
jgi:hypothetical protein